MAIRTIAWDMDAWEDYLYWQQQEKKTVKKIHQIIKEMGRNPFEGIGKPEPLKGDLAGFLSRRIDDEHRLVYAVEEDRIVVIAYRGHYDD